MKIEVPYATKSLLTLSSPMDLEELRSDKGLGFPSFGNPAIKASPDPWLCVPASQRVCLFREGVLNQINLQRFIGIDLENLTSPHGREGCYPLFLITVHSAKLRSDIRRSYRVLRNRLVISSTTISYSCCQISSSRHSYRPMKEEFITDLDFLLFLRVLFQHEYTRSTLA